MTYCTVAQARTAGAAGTDAEVLAAIAVAERLIDSYTGTWWEPRALTLVARVESDGTAFLPAQVQAVTSVTPVGAATVLAVTAYRVLSSTVLGQVDAVVLGAQGWGDALVLGAEPWAGGWPNLVGSSLTGQVAVAGTFGPTLTPPEVQDAAAALAAWRTKAGAFLVGGGSGVTSNDEGDSTTITLTVEQVATRSRTTGVAAVDALLAPLIHDVIRLG